MTDNLEQLEKDWLERRPKPFSAEAVVRMNLAMSLVMGILVSAVVALVGLDRIGPRSRHSDMWWVLDIIVLTLVILNPWLSAIVSYRRIKKVVVSGSSPSDVLLYIRYQGAAMLTAMFATLLGLITLITRSR